MLVLAHIHCDTALAVAAKVYVDTKLHIKVTLTHCDKSRRIHIVKGQIGTAKLVLVRRQLIVFGVVLTQIAPVNRRICIAEGEHRQLILSKIALYFILCVCCAVKTCEQPAVFVKVCRGEENLSAEAVEGHPYTHLSEAET